MAVSTDDVWVVDEEVLRDKRIFNEQRILWRRARFRQRIVRLLAVLMVVGCGLVLAIRAGSSGVAQVPARSYCPIVLVERSVSIE